MSAIKNYLEEKAEPWLRECDLFLSYSLFFHKFIIGVILFEVQKRGNIIVIIVV
jgi:hypothetical protein